MEHLLKPAYQIQANEVTGLMQTFWGEGNPIAAVSGQIESFNSTLEILKSAKTMEDKAKGKSYVTDNLVGKKISLGIRRGEDLIAHSGLIVKPWGEVECGGTIIAQEYRNRSLMRSINESRRILLREFASLDFQLTSFLLLGSNSVYYGTDLFDFRDLNMKTYFCNIGPYVYSRPLTVAQLDPEKLTNLSLKTEATTVSSSAQIIGIPTDKPPRIAKSLTAKLPQPIKGLFEEFPFLEKDHLQEDVDIENSTHYSPAKITICVVRKPFRNKESFLSYLSRIVNAGNNIIIQVPLQNGADNVIEQIVDIAGKDYDGVMLVPTGLTIINGSWSLTFASIFSKRLSHYRHLMKSILTGYNQKSLRELASYSLNAINYLQE